MFFPLAISFGSDTFAFFAGLTLGKHKLTPVSPKKTVEGAVGGILGGVIGMTLMMFIGAWVVQDAFLAPQHVLLFGILGSVVSQIGDLSFSVIKREFGVKDYGKLLPGHGGILDRFDSVTFVAPFVWLMLDLFGRAFSADLLDCFQLRGIDYEQDDFHFGRHRLHRPPDPGRGGAAGPHRGRPHRQLQQGAAGGPGPEVPAPAGGPSPTRRRRRTWPSAWRTRTPRFWAGRRR